MITGIVTGQDLRLGTPVIASDTINYITAQFVFKNALWDGLIKIAHFSNGEESADVELVDDAIRSEAGLNLTAGKWHLSLTGHEMSGGEIIKRITTVIAEFTVRPSGVQEGEPLPSLPSYGEQILAEVQAAEEDVTAIANAVNNIHADAQTLPAGSSATASAEIAEDAIHLSFGIPRGDKGEKGEDGHDYVLTSQDKQDIADIVLEEDVAAAIYDTVESTPVASFPDGAAAPVQSLTAEIVPVQDLHGYDAPWAPGAGKNKFDPSTAQVGKNWNGNAMAYSIASDYIPVTPGNYTLSISNMSKYSNLICAFFDSEKTYKGSTPNEHMTVQSGVSYVILSIRCDSSDSWTQSDLDNANIQFESGSTATSFAPYSNIRPISGWTECNVTRAGKNLFNPTFADYDVNNNYIYMNNVVKEGQIARFTFTDKDTSVDISGCYIGFQVGLSETQTTAKASRWAINNGTIQSNTTNVNGNGIVCPGVFIYPKTEEAFSKLFSRYNIMVELGSTATAYEPYRGDTYTVLFGSAGTVYGWTLDVTTGKLTVDKANIASYAGETLPGAWISDRDVYAAGTTPTIGAQVVYDLATPLVYNLSPVEIRTLAGQNTIWADTGDVTVKYTADTKQYIDKRIREIIAEGGN